MKKFFSIAIGLISITGLSQETVIKGKELFGDLKARQIGPAIMSGRISDLALHPTNNQILLAGAAGGGVWKSSDGGVSFNSIFDKHIQSIGCITFDPKSPDNVIWVGTGETWTRNSVSVGDGIYKTTDGGVNWTNMGLPKSEHISSIIVDPKNSDNIWVGVLGALWGDSEERGIYNSKDGGRTWNKVFYLDQKTGCSDLVIDPNNPEVMYAAFWEFRRTAWSFSSGGNMSALYKSTDSGKTWSKIHNGFPKGQLGRIAVAVAPSNSSIVYAVVECEKDAEKGLYKSEDGGNSWKHLNNDFGLTVRPFYFSRIMIDPKDSNIVYKGGLLGSISRDGGKTFQNLGAMHADIHDFAIDPIDTKRIYVATDGGVYRSWNNGSSLDMVKDLPVSQFYHVTLDNQEPYNVYGGLQDNGSWFAPSKSEGGIEARDWTSVGAGDGFRVLAHPTKRIVYSEMQGAENIWRYNLESKELKTIQPLQEKGVTKLRFNWNTPIVTGLHNPDRIYAGSQFVHVSDDMGATWKIISPDLTTNNPAKMNQENSGGLSKDNSGAENHCTLFTIAESPKSKEVIWTGSDDGQVQLTQDGGKTWKNVTANIKGLPANTWCYHIEASNFNTGSAYAVFDGHTASNMNPYVFKTTDFGQNWTSIITKDVDGFTRCIQEDYENENLLFLGTEKGLYVTIDGGKNWSKFENEMPAVAVMHLDLHKKTNDLVMATHGRGIIILDDISILRQINNDILAKDVHFFNTKPAIKEEQSSFGSTAYETEFVGSNPNSVAKIVYYLKKRNAFGKMDMEIQTLEGKKIVSLGASNQKGLNIVSWGYNEKTPKSAKGKTLDPSSFSSPIAPAGKYKAVLTKGKDKFEHIFEISNDPKSPISETSRAEQRKVALELFDKVQKLAHTVYELDEMISLNNAVLAKDPSYKKTHSKLDEAFNKLKNTMVITTGDNYVGSAEKQLREKLGAIYSSVCSQYDAPSPAQKANIVQVMDLYSTAENSFKTLKGTYFGKLIEKGTALGLTPKVKTFEEFVAE
jgi:photosystem II stability/assembly factor-like uncharacterized protein